MANDPTAIRQSTFTFNATDQTPHCAGVNMGITVPEVTFEELSTGWTRRDVGNKNANWSAEFFENDDGDYTAEFFDKIGNGTAYVLAARPTTAVASVANPEIGAAAAYPLSWGLSIAPNSASRHTCNFAVDGAITKTTS